jgi:copper chaperone CopZ
VWGTPDLLKGTARRTDMEEGSSRMRRNHLVPMHTIYNVYTVGGMTCRHCAATVSAELSGMDNVTDVAVNLATGTVTVASAHELSHHLVETAVAHAGYQLVD